MCTLEQLPDFVAVPSPPVASATPSPRSAALVSQEHAHRISGPSNHVVSGLDRGAHGRRGAGGGERVSASDWAHVLPEAETGCLLLAPEHEVGWWRHAVVLVLNHEEEGHAGSTGVILNRPTDALLHRVVPELDYTTPHHEVLANRPVRTRESSLLPGKKKNLSFPRFRKTTHHTHALIKPPSFLSSPLLSSKQTKKNKKVSMGGPMGREKGTRCLVALSREPLPGATSEVFPGLWHVSDFGAVRPEHEPHLSVFVGYCGWMDGQLNAEVQAGGWQVAAASASNTLALVGGGSRSSEDAGAEAGNASSDWTLRGRRLRKPRAPGSSLEDDLDLVGQRQWESLRSRLGAAEAK